MGFLTHRPQTCIQYGGRRYWVNPAFNIVLDIQTMYEDERLEEIDKLDAALAMLIVKPRKVNLSTEAKCELLQRIIDTCIRVPQRPKLGKQQKLFDFDLDGEYIYASFLMDYGIDLIEQQGRLPWRQFIALFQGLSDKTKIKEIMQIRSMDLPKPTKYNQQEIQRIMELKSYYALPVRGGGGQGGLDALFHALEQAARR